jgi:hypothetical protein
VEKKQEKTVEKMEIVSWWRTVHFCCFLMENGLIDININKGNCRINGNWFLRKRYKKYL